MQFILCSYNRHDSILTHCKLIKYSARNAIEILEGTPVLEIRARIIGGIYENKDEQYSPLKIIDVNYVIPVDG